MNSAMWRDLGAKLTSAGSDPSVRCVILRGDGDAFCAGADIDELKSLVADPQLLSENNKLIRETQLTLEGLSKPTIACIRGACVGGGTGLAMACDFRIAAEGAKFAITPAKLGLLYSEPDTRRLVNLVGLQKAKEILFLADLISAEQALATGLISQIVPPAELSTTVEALAARLVAASASSIAGTKVMLGHIAGNHPQQSNTLHALFEAAFTSDDCREGIAAFLEKRPANFNP